MTAALGLVLGLTAAALVAAGAAALRWAGSRSTTRGFGAGCGASVYLPSVRSASRSSKSMASASASPAARR
ncbi:MAG TPA: hypothetical protein VFT61_05180, partial [Sphingomicrobium sp.]|nr:hypothetical protein [Sphingomicrobium sp.]